MLINLFTLVINIYKSILNNHCIFCLDPSKNTICNLCSEALPKLSHHCYICAEPNYHGEICGNCVKSPPIFDHVVSPFIYSGSIKKLIIAFKAKPNAIGSDLLISTLSLQLSEFSYDCVIPVPYHWKSLLVRGHNPVRELACQLSLSLNIKMIDGLNREQYKPSQKTLNRHQRFANLQGAFSLNIKAMYIKEISMVRAKKDVKGKNILLVDDVLTTGATCNSAARTLKQAGAKSITVACLARTPGKT
jgi:ComF family protein